ncbi:hypothetical protein WJX72_004254 [[Myrmecia] bisecta]|uniref:Uncharacterized protein n=1 Tax=[Myrmecia] bisecta TaxID=41462 RepID=A0AAW1PTH8_9CHLO
MLAALSWPVCDQPGLVWATSSPKLEPPAPYYNLLFFCTGGINFEGNYVDACLNSGSQCGEGNYVGQPAAEAFCEYLGFDHAVKGQTKVVAADYPTHSLTGEWCLRAGQYADGNYTSQAQFDRLGLSGQDGCKKLDTVVCYRDRATSRQFLDNIQSQTNASVAAAPIVAPFLASSPTTSTDNSPSPLPDAGLAPSDAATPSAGDQTAPATTSGAQAPPLAPITFAVGPDPLAPVPAPSEALGSQAAAPILRPASSDAPSSNTGAANLTAAGRKMLAV